MSVFFFCKQKTAYEMRISDWRSDVCSSDLQDHRATSRRPTGGVRHVEGDAGAADVVGEDGAELVVAHLAEEGRTAAERGDAGRGVAGRSEERRVGIE